MKTEVITMTSPLTQAEVQSRLASATDLRGPASARVLESRAFGPRDPALPRFGFLRVERLGEDEFQFSYFVNRCAWPIVGRVIAEGTGSRVLVRVPIITTEALLRLAIWVGVLAVWWVPAFTTRRPLVLAIAIALFALAVVTEVLGWRGALQSARRIAAVATGEQVGPV